MPDSRGMNMPTENRCRGVLKLMGLRRIGARMVASAGLALGVATLGVGCEASAGSAARTSAAGDSTRTGSSNPGAKERSANAASPQASVQVPAGTTVSDGAPAATSASAPATTAIPVTTVSTTGGVGAPADEFDGAEQGPRFDVAPGVEGASGLAAYTKFVVDPVAVRLSASAGGAALSPDELKHLSDSFRMHLGENLGELMQAATDAGPGTVRLRCTLGRLAAGSGASESTVSLASAGCKVEVQDSVTGKVLATFVDASTPPRLAASRSGADLNKACLRQWGELFVQRMDEARSK